MIVGLLLLAFNWPVKDKNEDMTFHVSFSSVYARDLGLDWKKTYETILDELQPEKIRIAAYWTEIEKEKGKYDFSDLDWQIEEATKRNTKIVLAFGIKAPRWPECFIPAFYMNDKKRREASLIAYEGELVNRYKHNENIIIWQVENEPFLPFGNCPEGAIDSELVDREIEQVKKLNDTKPIMVNDSGELSLWYQAAKRADIFGTTLYRIIYKEPYGYIKYPIGPRFFRIKAWMIETFASQENIIISELQAEPWGPDWISHISVEEQYKSMNPQKFKEIIEYAQATGFEESYLWGSEWWYWLKEVKQRDEMWDVAKKVMTKRE